MIRKRAKRLAGAVLAAGAITAMPFQAFAQRSPEFAYSAEKWATLRDNKLEFDEISDLVHEYNPTVFSCNNCLRPEPGHAACRPYPRPNVGSAVIRLTRHKEMPVQVADPKLMFRLIRASFNQRRKTLQNGLNNAPDISFTKEQIVAAIESLGVPATREYSNM